MLLSRRGRSRNVWRWRENLQNLASPRRLRGSPISPARLVAIESGKDLPRSLDIAVVAESTGLPIGWFLEERPQLVASRKPAPEGGVSPAFDLVLERLSVHVEQLVSEGIIAPAVHQGFRLDEDHDVIARRAAGVRDWADAGDEPIRDLSAFCERVGLLVFASPSLVLRLKERSLRLNANQVMSLVLPWWISVLGFSGPGLRLRTSLGTGCIARLSKLVADTELSNAL